MSSVFKQDRSCRDSQMSSVFKHDPSCRDSQMFSVFGTIRPIGASSGFTCYFKNAIDFLQSAIGSNQRLIKLVVSAAPPRILYGKSKRDL